jgi:hypothetical protein
MVTGKRGMMNMMMATTKTTKKEFNDPGVG